MTKVGVGLSLTSYAQCLTFHSTVLICLLSILCYLFSLVFVNVVAALRILLGRAYMITVSRCT